jgi:glycosyltransferase involved in cell wall biosynthesis
VRIAIVNWTSRRVAGAESYINSVLLQLSTLGHALAYWHEIDGPVDREPIKIPDGVPVWSVANLGSDVALKALRNWQPDLIFAHGLLSPGLEAATLKIAPAVFFAHDYYGTCISGAKTFKSPVVRPCDRRFGPACLLHYFPHRCGGLNPVTMLRLYSQQSKRLELLPGYKAIVTQSAHMRQEYLKHGIESERIFDLLDYAGREPLNFPSIEDSVPLAKSSNGTRNRAVEDSGSEPGGLEWRLLFLGRMEFLKGGSVFLDALPQVSAALRRSLRITFVGDGSKRFSWEQKARLVQTRHPNVRIEFTGWLKDSSLESSMTDCDLLVLPSLWPEPFGLVGLEMGQRGVPVAAFAVGGIPNWLVDGVNGHLASGDPPTASSLAESIIKCLRDPLTHDHLRRGAKEMAERFEMQIHTSALMKIFETVLTTVK